MAQPQKTDLERLAAAISGGAPGVAAAGGLARVEADVAALLDHTLLKPEAGAEAIRRLCAEAAKFGFATVCVNSVWIRPAVAALRGTQVRVCTVVGFPLGATLPAVKLFEAERAISAGATEVDMVIHVGALKSGADDAVESDIRGVVDACHRRGAICKVILEMGLLTQDEKVRGCQATVRAGADFVKTSTGFGPGGATVEDVALLRATAPAHVGIKAAGGIRTLEDVAKMIAAGASRIGSSSGVKILEELRALTS